MRTVQQVQTFVQSIAAAKGNKDIILEVDEALLLVGTIEHLVGLVEALKGPYPPPAERGEYAVQSALFDLYQAADAVKRSAR